MIDWLAELVSKKNEITSYRRSSCGFPNDKAFAALNNRTGVIELEDPIYGGDISSFKNDLKSEVKQVFIRAMGFTALTDSDSVFSCGDYCRWRI